jgi:hypothetical protein
MTSDNWLFILVISIWIVTAYLIAKSPDISPDERKKMEEDWWS